MSDLIISWVLSCTFFTTLIVGGLLYLGVKALDREVRG
jgi:hypothetical protein